MRLDEKDEPILADQNKKTMAYTYDGTEIEVLPGTLDSAETTRSPQRKPSISTDTLLKGVENVNGNLTLSDFGLALRLVVCGRCISVVLILS